MTTATAAIRLDQCETLRRLLQRQRLLIAQQLGPTPLEANSDYPRSMMMRFLIRRSDLVVRLLVEFAALLIGTRFVKSISAAMSLSRITRTDSMS